MTYFLNWKKSAIISVKLFSRLFFFVLLIVSLSGRSSMATDTRYCSNTNLCYAYYWKYVDHIQNPYGKWTYKLDLDSCNLGMINTSINNDYHHIPPISLEAVLKASGMVETMLKEQPIKIRSGLLA